MHSAYGHKEEPNSASRVGRSIASSHIMSPHTHSVYIYIYIYSAMAGIEL